MFSFLSKIPVISQIDPSKTWVYYQLAVVIGTWVFAAGIWYTAYLIKSKVIPLLEQQNKISQGMSCSMDISNLQARGRRW